MGGSALPVSFLTWDDSCLVSTGSRVGLMAKTSRRAHAYRCFLGQLLLALLSLWWATANPHLCSGPSNASRQVWFSLLWGHSSFLPGPDVPRIWCVPSRSGASPTSQGLWKSAVTSFRLDSLGITSLFGRSQGWEAWCGAQHLLNSGRTSVV